MYSHGVLSRDNSSLYIQNEVNDTYKSAMI